MPNVRTTQILAPEKSILAFPDHYVNVTGKISYANLASMAKADTDFGGANTLKKGTVVCIADDGAITAAESAKGNGVVFNTVKRDDYTCGVDEYINVTVLVHGFVRKDRLDGATNLNAPLIYVVAE